MLSQLVKDGSDDIFNSDTDLKYYFDYITIKIKKSLLEHRSNGTQTMQENSSYNCLNTKCKGKKIYDNLIYRIEKLTSGK